MILFVQTRQGGDRWSFSHAFWETCCCLCITVLIALSSTAISRVVAARAGGLLLPGSGGCAGDQQRGPLPPDPRLPGLGGGLRLQPRHPHRRGRVGGAEERLSPAPF